MWNALTGLQGLSNQFTGQAIDTIGKTLGNPLPEFGFSEFLTGKAHAAEYTPPPQNKGVAGAQTSIPVNTGGTTNVTPGGYNDQNNLYATGPSRQQKWEAAGHKGIAPEGYNGESTPSAPDPFQMAIESAFGSKMNYLNQAESQLRSGQGSIESDILSQAETSKNLLGSNRDASLADVGRAEEQGQVRNEDALSAARRLYNELVTGGQQRFGGASTAGEAYAALAGRELQRNRQQIATDFSSFMGQIEGARQTIQTQFDNGVAQLEQQKNMALNQAKREFQDRLLEISRLRSQAEEDKASARLSALTDLRNQIFQINLASSENSQALQQLRTQAEGELQRYAQSATQNVGMANTGAQTFSANTNTNPGTTLAMSTQGGGQVFNPTGSIRDDEELRGVATPRRDDFFAFA